MKLRSTIERWQAATHNLRTRRVVLGHPDDNRSLDNTIRDYKLHLTKCGVGDSVLDVGCGDQFIKKCLPDGFNYTGIDAFPISGLNIYKCAIESEEATRLVADTVCAMAVLDNCLDFDLAIENIKIIARKNVIILTGIGIDPDQYHTFRLELDDFDSRFVGWKNTIREQLQPKVWLLNFQKP